ncbi:hypothetical protein NVP1121O_114 [Vibrio phage 1.121.O._10N.286.46.C4]|nr:hypothetical protein NVP1121O_114 [Vibrio phage 1.121.O._10N.286.46.C4]
MSNFELSMDTNSVHHWDIPQAVREYIQNYLDNSQDSIWDYDPVSEVLTLTNRNTSLPRRVFLHGNSSKQGDNSTRGQYGDGIKSALAVLLREGVKVTFLNAGLVWEPKISYSETFQAEVISIDEYEFGVDCEDFTVKIKGITPNTFEEVVTNTLPFQDDLGEMITTSKGNILKDPRFAGRIYSGGVFVCHFSTKYGFDINVGELPLDRDRKAVDNFQLRWLTKDMWGEVAGQDDEESAKTVMTSLKSNDSSIDFLSSAVPKVSPALTQAAEDTYKADYKDTLVTSSHEEFNALHKAGNKVSLVKNEGLVKIIQQTSEYKTFSLGAKKVKTIEEVLDEFKDEWQNEMSIELLDAFEDLCEDILDTKN